MNNSLNRRSFLRATGSLAAMAAISRFSLHAADDSSGVKKRPIRKAIMFGTVGLKGTTLEKFQAVKDAGFEGVEPNSHMNQDEALKAPDATGLHIPSVCCATHWDQTLTDPNPDVRQKGLDGLKQALRDAN